MTTLTTPRSGRTRKVARNQSDAQAPQALAVDGEVLEQIQDVVTELSERLLLTLRAESGSRQRRDPLESGWDAIVKDLPKALEQVFVHHFWGSGDSTRRHRALFSHLLSTAELNSIRPLYVKRFASKPRATAPESDETDELTSEQAAKLLHVSRTHLNTLVDEGKFPRARVTEGGHRRIPRADVLAYKAHTRAEQVAGLEQMTAASVRMGLYDAELEGIPVRQKD